MLNSAYIKVAFFAFCVQLAFDLSAGDMYKWKDADGIWHFSSKPPETSQQFDTVAMANDPKPMITMRKLGTEHEPEYSFVNNIWGPIELELTMPEAENITTDQSGS